MSEALRRPPPAIARLAIARLAIIGIGIAIVPLDTAVNIAFPAITRHFGLALPTIEWVVITYTLTYAGLVLACGRAGDIWSHERVYRIGLVWSAVAFVLCALAPDYGWLLVFRVVQGIGAGLVISCGPALVTALYPEARRSQALAAFTLIFALASALGPLVGSLLIARWGWSAVFWFRAPIALLAALIFRAPPRAASAAAGRESLDVVGAVLFALGLASLLLAFNFLPHLATRDLGAAALALVSAASFALFVRWEGRAPRPIVRLAPFREAGFAVANAASVVLNLASFGVLLLVPYYLARFLSVPLRLGGAVLGAGFVGMALSAPAASRLIARLGAARVAPIGGFLCGLGLFLVGFWRPGIPVAAMVGALLLQGFGLGLFQVAYMDIVMAALPPGERGVAGSLAMLTRTVGIVAGASALMLLFHAIDSGAAAGGAAAPFLAAFHATFRLVAALAAAAGLAILLVRRRRRAIE
jgi:MFS family permease